ncbi:hypothetical protein DXG01_015767, partial [Tephrocybe rancida]
VYETGKWKTARVLDTDYGVAAVAWHPKSSMLAVGMENGDIVRVPFTAQPEEDRLNSRVLNRTGPIFELKWSPSGRRLAVVCGSEIKLLNGNLLGGSEYILLESDMRDHEDIDVKPAGLHFLNEDTIIVAFHEHEDGI